jgi:hypothetical protein
LWIPISCCAPGLLSYSYYFAYMPPKICSQDRLSTKAEVYFGFSRTPPCLLIASPVFPGEYPTILFLTLCFFLVFVWTQDPTSLLTLKICTPVANTGKLRSIGQVPVDRMTDISCFSLFKNVYCCLSQIVTRMITCI